MIEALRQNGGIQSLAANALGVSPQTIGRFIKKHPDLEIIIEECVAEVADLAQGKLLEAITDGEAWAIRYYLDNKGQAKGYGQRKLAFKDDDGVLHVPAVLVTNPVMTVDEWEAKYPPINKPGQEPEHDTVQ